MIDLDELILQYEFIFPVTGVERLHHPAVTLSALADGRVSKELVYGKFPTYQPTFVGITDGGFQIVAIALAEPIFPRVTTE